MADNKYSKMLKDCEALKMDLENSKVEIDGYKHKLFDGVDSEEAIEIKVDNLVSSMDDVLDDVNDKKQDILAIYNEIAVDNSAKKSIKTKIDSAYTEIEVTLNDVNIILSKTKQATEELDEFHKKVFGYINEDDEQVDGLKLEIEKRFERLDEYEKVQKEKNEALYKRIETLLPGATDAGLAKAYQELKNGFTQPIKIWNGVFIVTLATISIVSFFGLKDLATIDDLVKQLIHSLPIIAPLIWIAIYASKRRSENQRLEQEYAHKEALAKSYSSYKMQIEELKQADQTMLIKLLDSTINTIAHNASETLDKKHGDNMPAQDATKNIADAVKALVKLVDDFRKK